MKMVSFVIPTAGKNSEGLLNLIGSIYRCKVDSEVEINIIVNSIDLPQFKEIEKKLSHLKKSLNLIFTETTGVNHARNLGLATSKGEFVFFLDDDVVIENEDYILRHENLHEKYLDVFCIGGGYYLSNKKKYFDKLYNLIQMSWFYKGFKTKYSNGCYETYYLLGGNFSMKRNIASEFDIRFDENITYGSSEYDFFIQAQKKNQILLATDLDVLHNTHESFFSIIRKVYKQGKGKRIIDNKGILKLPLIEEASSKITESSLDLILLKFYNYCYWYGYFYKDSKLFKITMLIFTDFIKYLNQKRYKILDKFKT